MIGITMPVECADELRRRARGQYRSVSSWVRALALRELERGELTQPGEAHAAQ